MNTDAVDALLADIRSDGRYDADYTVTYEAPESDRPSILVTVASKKTGPPVILLGSNIEAETATTSRWTLEGTLIHQDLGGYGSELRGHIKVGWLTQLDTEYFRKLPGPPVGGSTIEGAKLGELFVAPRVGLLRQPFYIYRNQNRLSERQLQTIGDGIDVGWTDQRIRELRVGWEMDDVRWQTQVGSATDALPDVFGSMEKARVRYVYDTQDRALVPQYGMRLVTQAGYLFSATSSRNAPQITMQGSLAHTIGKNLAILSFDSGTMFNRNVAQPFRFTLGGPLRLTASAFDEYRGTDYFLLSPAFLRRIASLPQPLGQSLYFGFAYEAGQMRAPDAATVTRQDIYFGVVAETPLGVITLAPAIGGDGHRKFVFTLGRLF
jgi:NTE family protein